MTAHPTRLRPFKPRPFGRYTLLSPLAVGGMGEIYLARLEGAQGFEKLCVIKKILPQLASDAEFLQRFVNEARVLVKLSHGAIAQVLDMGVQENEPYLALEHVDGKDLRRVLMRVRDANGRVPLHFALYVITRVLDALAYAHRKRDDEDREIELVHRDVSPQNILISYEGEVKVIDFGLAKSRLSVAKTNPAVILGKFLYMAPEQARHSNVDRRSDLYAVGLCLYELLAGKNPFDDVPTYELMERVATPRIAPLDSVTDKVPQKLVAIVQKAISVDPAQRFQTAEEMRASVMAVLYESEPNAGPESVARLMRELFAHDHAAERRLFSSLQAARSTSLPEESSRQPLPPGRAVSKVAGPIEPMPLSFAPTPRTGLSGQELDGVRGTGVAVKTSLNPNITVLPERASDEASERSKSAIHREGPTRAAVTPEAGEASLPPPPSESFLMREGLTRMSTRDPSLPYDDVGRVHSYSGDEGSGPEAPEWVALPGADTVAGASGSWTADAPEQAQPMEAEPSPVEADPADEGSGADLREGPTRVTVTPRRRSTPPPAIGLRANRMEALEGPTRVTVAPSAQLEGPTVVTSVPGRPSRELELAKERSGTELPTLPPLAHPSAGLEQTATHDTQPTIRIPDELRETLGASATPPSETQPRAELPPGLIDPYDSALQQDTRQVIRVPADLFGKAPVSAAQPRAPRHGGIKALIALAAAGIVLFVGVALLTPVAPPSLSAEDPRVTAPARGERPPDPKTMDGPVTEELQALVPEVEDGGAERDSAGAKSVVADGGSARASDPVRARAAPVEVEVDGGEVPAVERTTGEAPAVERETGEAPAVELREGGSPPVQSLADGEPERVNLAAAAPVSPAADEAAPGAEEGGGMLSPLLNPAAESAKTERRSVSRRPQTALQEAFVRVSESYGDFMRERSCRELRYKVLCSRFRRLKEGIREAGNQESAALMDDVLELEEKLEAARAMEL